MVVGDSQKTTYPLCHAAHRRADTTACTKGDFIFLGSPLRLVNNPMGKRFSVLTAQTSSLKNNPYRPKYLEEKAYGPITDDRL